MANTMRKNTDAGTRGGASRSSDEASVMEVERRDLATRQGFIGQLEFRRNL